MNRILSAEELYHLFMSDPVKFEKMILDNDPSFLRETVSERLKSLMENHKVRVSYVVQKSLLSKSYFYQLLEGERQPSRDVLLRIGIVCGCSAKEIQALLLLAGEGALYTKLRRDAAILSCVGKKMNLYEIDDYLIKIGEKGIL